MGKFKSVLVAAVLALAATVPGYCGTPDAKLVQTFTTVAAGTAYTVPAVGVFRHTIQWTVTGSPASCTVKLQQSNDNTNWTDLIAAQTCTANGQSAVVVGNTLAVRLNVTALSAGGTLQAIYTGFNQEMPSASAANLGTQPSSGAQISEKGGRWSVISAPAVSTIGSAVKGAGAAGVRHVADCVSFSAGAVTAPTATQLTINLRDGASGAGTVIWSKTVVIPATSATHLVGDFCGLNLIGTAATAMTLEFSALLTNEFESVTITGYDVQ